MLTKEERAGIVERVKRYDGESDSFYYVLFGYSSACDMTYEEYNEEVLTRILNLCDTSNMVELPVDKDGVPFKRGDTVYESDGTEHIVDGYAFSRANAKIVSVVDLINNTRILFETDELTHKRPVTIASLVGEIRRTLSQNAIMNKESAAKLWEITDQIEMLGDSDAN